MLPSNAHGIQQRLILNEEINQREQLTLAESCAYSKIIKSYSEHLKKIKARTENRELQEARQLRAQREAEIKEGHRQLSILKLKTRVSEMEFEIRDDHANNIPQESVVSAKQRLVHDTRTWIENNPNATQEEYEQRLDILNRGPASTEVQSSFDSESSDAQDAIDCDTNSRSESAAIGNARRQYALFITLIVFAFTGTESTGSTNSQGSSDENTNSSIESPNLTDVQRNVTPSHSSEEEEEVQAIALPEGYSNLPN